MKFRLKKKKGNFFKKKGKGVILVIFGFYLLFVNTILSILFNRVPAPCIPNPYGPDCVKLDPINYLQEWLLLYGAFTILIALGGLALIIYSTQHFLITKEFETQNK